MNTVHVKRRRHTINPAASSKEEIIRLTRELALKTGFEGISIRKVAEAGGIATGTVYNYFPSKSELVSAVVADIWNSIFHRIKNEKPAATFLDLVTLLYDQIRNGTADYPSFFTFHSAQFSEEEKTKGREVMSHYLGHIHSQLLEALQRDSKVRPGLFTQEFTQDDFVHFVFDSMLSCLAREHEDCTKLLYIVERLLYR